MVKWVTLISSLCMTSPIRVALTTALIMITLLAQTSGFRPIEITTSDGARKLFGGYRITPKHCRATKTLSPSDPRVNGPSICMFNHECAQRNGEVVGACMDGFLFGACCQIPNNHDIESTLINDAQNAYFQQHQAQQQQLEAAQSYETYGGASLQQQYLNEKEAEKNSYQSQQQQPQQHHPQVNEQENIDKVYQQLDSVVDNKYQQEQIVESELNSQEISSSTNYAGTTPTKISNYAQEQEQQQPIIEQDSSNISENDVIGTASTELSQSYTSAEPDNDAKQEIQNEVAENNSAADISPPTVHVHKNKVTISSPSSPPHNDEFVMQIMSTLAPGLEDDHITFTTEVPMKIVNSLVDHSSSSESNSFEEETEVTKVTEIPSHSQVVTSNTHQNINDILLDGGEFSHSDITHPGADADLVEDDLQFSTGYGPQPQYVKPNNQQPNYVAATTEIPAVPEDKYVLVQTINSDKKNRKPPTVSSPTTTSMSITTHVDSIESIILQLNNSNHGPTYNVENQNNPGTYEGNTHNYETTTNLAGTTVRPLVAANTYSPEVSYYEEVETMRPENFYHIEQPGQQTYSQQDHVPENADSYVTDINETAQISYDTDVEDEHKKDYLQNTHPTVQPDEEYNISHKNHSHPESNYNDVSAVHTHTSEFNKMPAVGIAYPVDMSYFEGEDDNIALDESEQEHETTAPQKPQNSYVQHVSSQPESHTLPTYTRVPVMSENRPIASYIGVLTAQTYNQKLQPQASVYNQIPDDVSISQTTKIQSDYNSDSTNAYETSTSEKYSTNSYINKPSVPQDNYISSTSAPLELRPQYESSIIAATAIPVLVTAGTNKPRPSSKRPTPATHQKISKPPVRKTPTTQSSQINYHGQTQSELLNNNESHITKKPTAQFANNSDKLSQSGSYNTQTFHSKKPVTKPTNAYHQQSTQTIKPSTSKKPAPKPSSYSYIIKGSTNNYSQTEQNTKSPSAQPVNSYNQEEQDVLVTSSKRPTNTRTPGSTQKPPKKNKPDSTSYVTGGTTPRPPVTFGYYDEEVPPLIIADDKLDSFVHNTAQIVAGANPAYKPSYATPISLSSVTPISVQQPQFNYNKKPGFVKIQSTMRPPVPTVLITPKPTVINLVTSSTWTQKPYVDVNSADNSYQHTTPTLGYGSTSYIYSPLVTRRPEFAVNTPGHEHVSMQSVTSNDFDDPGYYGAQNTHNGLPQVNTPATYSIPSDDRPAFPGYYGPTPTYPAFQVPVEKIGAPIEQETFPSNNDFVNFPPVRNPNLNMSATSSSVTSDFELSTPAFVEDVILKDKMNTLVNKIVESLQDNFDALSDMIDESNYTASAATYQASVVPAAGTTVTRKTTPKPTRIVTTSKPKQTTSKPKQTTRKPVTRAPTKKPTVATTRKPVRRVTTTTTRKPVTRNPTRRTTTTTQAPEEDEIVDEEDEEDVNPIDNEIDQSDTISAAGSRKIQCGLRPHVKSGRIVGGKGSTFGAFPWQVLVRESTWLGLFTKNKCGGVLITNRYVITAAHCQPGFLASLVAVMGEYDISGDLESKRAVTKNVKRVIVHRQYDPATFENDLALLELESPVQFDTHIVPICMPFDNADFTGRMATVTGWGRLKYGGGVPSVLQEVQVPVIENSVCQEMFHTAGHNKKILGSFLCAGYANGQKDSCEGDSGGPLVLQRPDGRYELAGTVSHGIKCAAPYLPGVYMRTTFYKPWLRSITGVK